MWTNTGKARWESEDERERDRKRRGDEGGIREEWMKTYMGGRREGNRVMWKEIEGFGEVDFHTSASSNQCILQSSAVSQSTYLNRRAV